MNAPALACLVLCFILAQSTVALGNGQPIDPGKAAGAGDQPTLPSGEKKPVAPAKKRSKELLGARKRPDIDMKKPGAPAKRPEAADK